MGAVIANCLDQKDGCVDKQIYFSKVLSRMTDLMIWVSVGAFLLLPYYLCVFTFHKTLLRCHVVFWVCFHVAFVGVFLLAKPSQWLTPAILCIAYGLYYFFSHLFYVGKVFREPERSNVPQLITTRPLQSILFVVMIGLAVLWAVDCIVFMRGLPAGSGLETVYLITVVSLSYVQLLFYYFRYYRHAKHVK